MRYITCPAINKKIPLESYIVAIKLAKANPDKEFTHGLTTWWPTLGKEIMEQFVASVHDRINQAIPYCNRGVK